MQLFREMFEPLEKPLWQHIADVGLGILLLYWAWEWRASLAWCIPVIVLGLWDIQTGSVGALRHLRSRLAQRSE